MVQRFSEFLLYDISSSCTACQMVRVQTDGTGRVTGRVYCTQSGVLQNLILLKKERRNTTSFNKITSLPKYVSKAWHHASVLTTQQRRFKFAECKRSIPTAPSQGIMHQWLFVYIDKSKVLNVSLCCCVTVRECVGHSAASFQVCRVQAKYPDRSSRLSSEGDFAGWYAQLITS